MTHQRITTTARPRPLLFLLACVVALALAVPSGAFADGPLTERAGDSGTPALPQVGDRPSERDDASSIGTTSSAASSSSDDDVNVALIVGLSLAGLAVAGSTWLVVHRRHQARLTPGGSV